MDVTAAALAHEIRTPLTTLRITLDLLDDALPKDAPVIRQLFLRLQRGIASIDDIIETLGGTAALDGGHPSPPGAQGSVVAAVRETIAMVQPLLDQRGQTLELHDQPGVPNVTMPDQALQQVLANLITNASKYSPPGAPIQVGIFAEQGWVRAAVRDHGPGVSAAEQAVIFDAYVRGEAAGGAVAGFGLGLHIVKMLVTKHGGRVGVESAPGDGATFWFELSSAAPNGAQVPSDADTSFEKGANRYTGEAVLIS